MEKITIMDIELIATIDEINQYRLGHVTKEGLKIALKELLEKLDEKDLSEYEHMGDLCRNGKEWSKCNCC